MHDVEFERVKEEEPLEVEDPKDTEIAYLKEQITELHEALRETEQFKPATDFTVPTARDNTLTDDEVFEYLRQRATQTGDILVIDRVGSGALVQVLAQYKGSFGVAELFLRVIK